MKNDKYSYFSTEIGDIFIDFSALYDKYRFLSKRIYYQGLQISNRYNSENVIIHAANDIGEVRMPDRDCFVNESEVMTLIGNKINEFAVSYLKGLCQRDLLKIPLNALKRYLGEAFMQDLDHIPSSWLYRFSGSNPENEKNRGHVTSRFSESHFDFCRENLGDTLVVEIDSGKYFDLPCNTNHGYRYWPIAFLFEMSDEHYVLVEEGDFPEGHWILENSIKIEDIHPTIRIQEKEHKSVEIEDETTEFLFCKSFRITSELNGRSLDTGDITEGYCLAPDPEDGEDIVIFANACTDDDAIIDSRSLVDENGYNQTLESIVRDEFQTLLKRRRFSNYPEKLIESELSSLAKYIEKGSTFILTFDEEVRAEKQ